MNSEYKHNVINFLKGSKIMFIKVKAKNGNDIGINILYITKFYWDQKIKKTVIKVKFPEEQEVEYFSSKKLDEFLEKILEYERG